MCGRYFIDDETSKEIKKILQQIDKKSASSEFGCRDIRPSDRAPVLTARKGAVDAEMIEWGFPGFQKKGLIINARSETVLEKPMFRDSVLNRRCILPASGYYEWSRDRTKYAFRPKNAGTLYMAGIYKLFDQGMRFVILTTAPNPSVQDIHDRMLGLGARLIAELYEKIDDEIRESLIRKKKWNIALNCW